MFEFFKKKKRQVDIRQTEKLAIKPIDYPAKIIIAWSKAIEGDPTFLKWLNENGYEELAIATHAIYLKEDARDWLQQNGYPHLMAMINGAEGNESAQKWLLLHGFDLLYHMALMIDHDPIGTGWLLKNGTKDLYVLTQTIQRVKDKIEENHNDIHSFGKDI